ncbi:MAG: hypothetical protein SNJ69_04525 [Chloroflexaceae bacterium]
MLRRVRRQRDTEIVFRRFLPWVLAEVGLYAGVLIGLLTVTIILGNLLIGLSALVPLFMAGRVLIRYHTEAVIVRGALLVMRYGILAMDEYSVPLWGAAPRYQHGLLARLLNYGTIQVICEGRMLRMRQVASFRTLRALIASRQATLMTSDTRLLVVSR